MPTFVSIYTRRLLNIDARHIDNPIYNSLTTPALSQSLPSTHMQPISTPQIAFAPSAERCPCRGRTDGPCSGFPAALGRQQCMHRLCGVSAQQSGGRISFGPCNLKGYTYMLIDQKNANVFPRLGEPLERLLDSGIVRLAVDNQKVLLRIRRCGDMLSHHQHLFETS